MIASIFTMLTGAFLSIHRANFATLAASERQREAQMACQAGIQFTIFRLQQNQKWGQAPFAANRDISPPRGMTVSEIRGTTSIVGEVLASLPNQNPGHFEVEMVNRLKLAASADGRVPADRVLLTVRGRSAGFELRSLVLLQGEPLYDASLTGHTSILLNQNLNKLTVDSADAARNWIRSNGDIKLGNFAAPSPTDTVTIKSPPDSPRGVVWAKGAITSGVNELQDEWLTRATNASGGLFSPRSKLHNDIYELRRDDLMIPDDAPVTLDPGVYAISLEQRTLRPPGGGDPIHHTVRALTHTDPTGRKTIWYNDSDYLSDAVYFGYDLVPPPGVSTVHMASGQEVRLGHNPYNPPYGALKFNFDSSEFATVSMFPLKVDGNIAIISDLGDENQLPKIKLDSEEWKSGIFEATGDIKFQGTVVGGGAIISGGDMYLGAESDIDADIDSGVVLYGQNVNVLGGNSQRCRCADWSMPRMTLMSGAGLSFEQSPTRMVAPELTW